MSRFSSYISRTILSILDDGNPYHTDPYRTRKALYQTRDRLREQLWNSELIPLCRIKNRAKAMRKHRRLCTMLRTTEYDLYRTRTQS